METMYECNSCVCYKLWCCYKWEILCLRRRVPRFQQCCMRSLLRLLKNDDSIFGDSSFTIDLQRSKMGFKRFFSLRRGPALTRGSFVARDAHKLRKLTHTKSNLRWKLHCTYGSLIAQVPRVSSCVLYFLNECVINRFRLVFEAFSKK